MKRQLILLALVSSTVTAQDSEYVEIPFSSAECTREKISVFRLNELGPTVEDTAESVTLSSFVQTQQWWVLLRDSDGVIHRYEAEQTETPDGKVVEMESKFGRFIVRMSDGSFIHTLRRDLDVHVATGNCDFRKSGSLVELAEQTNE